MAVFYQNRQGVFYGGLMNENGELIERTPSTHPYSYDGFVTWGSKTDEINATAYSDRLWRFDPEKHDRLCEKHFGSRSQYWFDREANKIEEFLCEYLGEKIKLHMIMEYCNRSSGSPYWRFDYQKMEENT